MEGGQRTADQKMGEKGEGRRDKKMRQKPKGGRTDRGMTDLLEGYMRRNAVREEGGVKGKKQRKKRPGID